MPIEKDDPDARARRLALFGIGALAALWLTVFARWPGPDIRMIHPLFHPGAEFGQGTVPFIALLVGLFWVRGPRVIRITRMLESAVFGVRLLTIVRRLAGGRQFLWGSVLASFPVVAPGIGPACLLRPKAPAHPLNRTTGPIR